MVAQSQAFRCRSLVKVVAQTCSCYRGSCRNDMLSFLPTRFETHWAHFRCSIWTYSSGRGQKFMLKQSLGPRDHTGMLSDQLRSAGHLSSSAPIASDSGRSFTGRHCSLSSATPMPAASSFAKKLCLSELPGSSLLSEPPLTQSLAPVFQRSRTEYSERSEFCRTGFNDAGFSMLFMDKDWLAGDL